MVLASKTDFSTGVILGIGCSNRKNRPLTTYYLIEEQIKGELIYSNQIIPTITFTITTAASITVITKPGKDSITIITNDNEM